MDTLNMTSRKRETYQVTFEWSLLWESALGIAAVTNKGILETLEKPRSEWKKLKKVFTRELLNELDKVERNNTWKALLQLIHSFDGNELHMFIDYINELDHQKLKYICLPYMGEEYQKARKLAAGGDRKAVVSLTNHADKDTFFPDYIQFISSESPEVLKTHLINVMNGWFNTVIIPEKNQTMEVLERDYHYVIKLSETLHSEQLVHAVTGGVDYLPEPSVHKVLLIPQIVYRPWNIEADIEDTKVFYYPVSNHSISPEDKYLPPAFMVQRYKALGDETRLKMIKILSENARSLQDITEILGMGKSTVHHHLKILRASKLVEVRDSRYHLRMNVLNMMKKELDSYLEDING